MRKSILQRTAAGLLSLTLAGCVQNSFMNQDPIVAQAYKFANNIDVREIKAFPREEDKISNCVSYYENPVYRITRSLFSGEKQKDVFPSVGLNVTICPENRFFLSYSPRRGEKREAFLIVQEGGNVFLSNKSGTIRYEFDEGKWKRRKYGFSLLEDSEDSPFFINFDKNILEEKEVDQREVEPLVKVLGRLREQLE